VILNNETDKTLSHSVHCSRLTDGWKKKGSKYY